MTLNTLVLKYMNQLISRRRTVLVPSQCFSIHTYLLFCIPRRWSRATFPRSTAERDRFFYHGPHQAVILICNYERDAAVECIFYAP